MQFTASIAVSVYIYNKDLLHLNQEIFQSDSTKSFPIFYIFGSNDFTVSINGCVCDNADDECCCGISDPNGVNHVFLCMMRTRLQTQKYYLDLDKQTTPIQMKNVKSVYLQNHHFILNYEQNFIPQNPF